MVVLMAQSDVEPRVLCHLVRPAPRPGRAELGAVRDEIMQSRHRFDHLRAGAEMVKARIRQGHDGTLQTRQGWNLRGGRETQAETKLGVKFVAVRNAASKILARIVPPALLH